MRKLERQSEKNEKKKTKNEEFAVVAYLFIGIFLAMIAYFAYFQIIKSEDFINNPYNSRIDEFSKRVIRGDIIASDGTVLATTVTDDDGNETRKYPQGRTYAHVVGFSENGKAGIESDYNFQLLRSHTFVLNQIAYEIAGMKSQGDTLVTTLDCDLQEVAYNALGQRDGAVVAIEPETGKILAMVSKPDYDPNTIVSDWETLNEDENSSLLNRATSGLYPPGSTFKIATTLEYIREHPTNYNDFDYHCTGSITSDNYTIHCFGGSVHGQLDLGSAFAKSCNTAFSDIGLQLDLDQYAKTVDGLLLNGNSPGKINSAKNRFELEKGDSDSEIMATAIGQGNTLVSPYAMALLVSAIRNKGTLMTPYLLDHIESDSGQVVESFQPVEYKNLMTKKEAKILRKYMRQVVLDGTAKALNTTDYTAAGKTGSAEFGTNKGESHAWFVGYASKKGQGSIAVAVMVEGAGNGGTVAVPIAKQLFDEYYK